MHDSYSDRPDDGVTFKDQTVKSSTKRDTTLGQCPNVYCVSNYRAANGSFCIEPSTPGCPSFVQANCPALKRYHALLSLEVLQCVTPHCAWVGVPAEAIVSSTGFGCPNCKELVRGKFIDASLHHIANNPIRSYGGFK